MRRLLLSTLLLLPTLLSAQDLKTPPVYSDEERALLSRGIEQHDRGNFDDAIATYGRVLGMNPDNPDAMYESALSSYYKGDASQAMEFLDRASGYDFRNRVMVYEMLGTIHDQQGEPELAIESYLQAIRIRPEYYGAHFNLGVTYMGVNRVNEALAQFKEAVERNPWHPGSHFMLGGIYFTRGLRSPALLAYSRVLIINPTGRYGAAAAEGIDRILAGEIGGARGNSITLNADTSEGNFMLDESTADIMASMLGPVRNYDEHVMRLENYFARIADVDSTERLDTGFARKTYTHFIHALAVDNHLTTFCHAISLKSNQKGASKWVNDHPKEMEALMAWVKDYTEGRWGRKPSKRDEFSK